MVREATEISECDTSLAYTMSSRTARAILRNSVSNPILSLKKEARMAQDIT